MPRWCREWRVSKPISVYWAASRRRPRGLPCPPVVRAVGVGLLLLVLLLSACSSSPPRAKRSFVGQSGTLPSAERVPLGLNPLGGVDTCDPHQAPGDGQRVLISRPEFFSQPASGMIAALRDALAQHPESREAVALLLTESPLRDRDEARAAGLACQAMVVLWEPNATRTLELTLPQPEQIPLRNMVRRQLCEFGDHQEQLRGLLFTILGLVATQEARYDQAVFYFETANQVDDFCLHLPGTQPTRGQPERSAP